MTGERSMLSSYLHLERPKETIAYGGNTKGEVIGVGDIPISQKYSITNVFILIRWVTIYYGFHNIVRLILIVTFRIRVFPS
jgi:hypothetical protein